MPSNSNLVEFTQISPNKSSPRSSTVSKITIHHCAGVMSIEDLGRQFQLTNVSSPASSNYGIGNDGRVGMYVDEKDRAWTGSSTANDNVAVTIEVSNSATGGDWPVGAKAMETLYDLCVDVCRRNGISALNFTGNANGNLTLHKYFTATVCPGPHLESRMNTIVTSVNKRLTACS